MSELKETKELRELKDEVVKCQKCPLGKTRTLPVIGQGSHQADIVFVGEAPGANEDRTGVPFCGKAGDVLDGLLKESGIKREDVYICNILKCRPPGNRDPQTGEVTACTPYLENQINIIQPKVIGALGNHAAAFILQKYGLANKGQGIGKLRGRIFEADAEFGFMRIVPLYHPAVVVYNNAMGETLKEDFKILKQIVNEEEIVF